MAEYFGDDHVIATQIAIRSRASEFSQQPLLVNGGRIMHILDPDQYGWDKLRAAVERDGYLALTMVDQERTFARLASEFGTDVEYTFWESFTGTPTGVLPVCDNHVEGNPLPEGWTVNSHTHPDDDIIDESQRLNQQSGVLPLPAYYMRGDLVPGVLTVVRDADGVLAACASATMRYHPDGPLSGWLFAGAVTVNPDHRRRGLGSYVNAKLLRDSYDAFGWTTALEQARAEK